MIRPSFLCHQTLLALAKSVFYSVLLVSCSENSAPVKNIDRPLLATTLPVARMVEAVMGQPVDRLVPDEIDAGQWAPSEMQLAQMSESFLISNGRGFETKLRRYDLPRTSWLRSANMLAEPAVLHDVVEHQHGPEGSHSHGVVDGHTWVDPETAGKQLEVIRQRLVQEGFCGEQQSQENVRPLVDQLMQIHQRFTEIDPQSTVLYANRAAYDYLARTHGWNITSFALDPKSPLPEEVASQLEVMDRNQIFLFESAPCPQLAGALDKLEIQPVVLHTGERPNHDGGWPECLAAGAERLQNAIGSLLTQEGPKANR